MRTLEFIKKSKTYNSTYGGRMFYLFFKDAETGKSYRTVLSENMRNFVKWSKVIHYAERGDLICDLRFKLYKGKEIVDADSLPKLITQREMCEIERNRFEEHYGIPPY